MTTSPFKIGDRVVIVKSPLPERVGTVTTILSDLHPSNPPQWSHHHHRRGELVHQVDLRHKRSGQFVVYPPAWLRPYRESNEPASEAKEEWLRDLCHGKVSESA